MTRRLYLAGYAVAVLLAACSDDGNGNEDTLLTGFSGLVILAVVVWLVVRAARKRGGQ